MVVGVWRCNFVDNVSVELDGIKVALVRRPTSFCNNRGDEVMLEHPTVVKTIEW
jgi:hypothetical protein